MASLKAALRHLEAKLRGPNTALRSSSILPLPPLLLPLLLLLLLTPPLLLLLLLLLVLLYWLFPAKAAAEHSSTDPLKLLVPVPMPMLLPEVAFILPPLPPPAPMFILAPIFTLEPPKALLCC
jgi:hypothetical protein